MNKMDNTTRLVAAGIGLLVLVLWLVLPVLTFSAVIPLFMINGFMLAYRVNQLAILFLLFPLFMTIAPLGGDKKITIIAGILNMVMCLALFLLRKQIIVQGNLGFLFKAGSALITGLGAAMGVTITEGNIDSYINVACDSFLFGGIGLWTCLIVSVIYIAFVLIFSQQMIPGTTPRSGSGSSTGRAASSGPSKGYSHRI